MTRYTRFSPGRLWLDDHDVPINSHGGGVLFHDGIYYWYGEHKIAGGAGNQAHVGVHCYASTDLYNWADRGIALRVSEDSSDTLHAGCVIERPKVIYNRATRQFVMWFHYEQDSHYREACSAVAVSGSPVGPFVLERCLRPNAGHWPLNVRPEQKREPGPPAAVAESEKFSNGENEKTPQFNVLGRDFARGQHARDMTVFLDDDGRVYHVYSSEHNSTLHIAGLTNDYRGHSGEYVRVFEHRWMEAPALFKWKGKYYLMASGCTGWDPNAARSAVADSIWGPWVELGNPCRGTNRDNGMGPEKSFGGQSTFVLPVHGREGAFIAMLDIWCPSNAIDGRYVWLPVQFDGSGFTIDWKDEWALT
jgi:beta-xylosidase